PVVAPDSGPFPYLVTHGLNGLLFETNSIEALKKAILSMLDDDRLYFRLCKGAQETSKNLLNPCLTFSQAVERAFSVSAKES
ncbi:MAG: glycosyltransferase, partial [Desulfobacteraceae bacterium]|nr:glycosyltransferase [Desulfobacteraceae bacterium]